MQNDDASTHENNFTSTDPSSIFMAWADKLFNIENHKYLIGLNSGILSALMTSLYQNPQPSLRTRLLLPAICGVIGVKAWENLVTERIEKKDLECSVCANIRGLVIAATSACILPATVGAIIYARRHTGVMLRVEKFTENFSDNISQRPVVIAAILAQGAIGYTMASREFEVNLLKRLKIE